MKSTYVTLALLATTGMVAFGQATQPNTPATQSPAPGQQTPSTQTQPATPRPTTTAGQQAMMTWTGCIQSETDFRRTQGAGGAGVAGSGIGAGNEYILTNASMSPAGSSTAATSGSAGASGVAGTAGARTASTAFELTGAGEGQAATHVGRRVEVTGHLKAAEVAGSAPSGGPTAGAPPRGVDIASADLKLREIEVTSIRAAAGGGSCAAAGTPAPAGAQPSQQP